MLANIRIVLVETSHPGNIGAIARAMKNMALSQLYLVKPKIFPSADATARASGADDILASAVICDTLTEAVADCEIVMGASARDRTIGWPTLVAKQCAEQALKDAQNNQVALVFGRENSGLTNAELDCCQYLIRIPCNKDFSSLNLAAAVQVFTYELFSKASQQIEEEAVSAPEPLATSAQIEGFYQHLQETLTAIDFIQSGQSNSVMRRLRRLYSRSRLSTREVDILRGILRMSQGRKQ
ncbi:MAG: RNA methyltransferase [Methylococcales bacterium]|nr:RNA methyltransferase [Methylococcales bacterium]MBT3507109.1 RNA methyltransferase [Methylococcales bacterium]MBT3699773.1 RNA methyltransferase [Methylococcales bacterium]MBT3815141.1 RNA methyltransferase [Methylococcales bacterium]MBT4031933.1 RNA methyltransferase [Methylococcales bacterium]